MNFQIKKLILWPKKSDLKPKEIEFKLGKINIITGASRTGKSAIVPIIDYCLGSGSCHIPVKTIRNACSWFGIIIQTNDKEILLARREPGLNKSTDEMFVLEGEYVDIPKTPHKNTTRDSVKKYLDEQASLSFLEIESDTTNNYFGRPSFRDLMAFCFQPQNIVANADTLFYKADTTDHRTKLINIFPYILGAVTPDILAKRQEINVLLRELRRKEKDLSKLKDVAEKWKIEISGWLSAAEELGLVEVRNNLGVLSFNEQLEILSSISDMKASDSSILNRNIQASSREIVALRREEQQISLNLSSFKNRYTEMSQLMDSIEDYRESLTIQIERLNISKWLRSLTEDEENCPIFGFSKNHPKDQINKFYNSLIQLEEESGYTNKIPAAFEREYESVKTEIDKLSEQLTATQKRIRIQSNIRNSSANEKYTMENISRFLGQVQYASETFESLGSDSQLSLAIAKLNERLGVLRAQVNENAIIQRVKAALRTIEGFTIKLLPLLDSERPNDPIKIDYENLTVIVTGTDGRDDYLWEIGSGSNWLAYHISVTLAFQLFFNQQKHSPVPNFIVYDQPSQVYFPQKLAAKESEKDLDPKLNNDEDQIAVKKIFITMSQALSDSKNAFQVIVLEHADKSIYGGIEGVHEVCEWRGENEKLIPLEWIN
ncbi:MULTISPECIES: DUF3732 domain-containing protein [unclassified Paenibacillus]|uniref:DUF3732 domain-containing protein n=1 Tax=unclassified Paenibacillus TaxID=185978 RepID=UPI002405772E|nr:MULTISPECIES: DUF3732 domain-containing protein [unclassified Paenibacillus]MDF9845503.1 hypothetical protein [Paenibacillus sp. PastF-2]MDF9852079.1 hypothetical protein [Paenibacillus sp. PastM-2]MDF9858669.1 hypothetical protein [Paenibacillus sp. PastF-1]MDH6483921.1 hypothetical protein [Paenibacillus sp. PastH-2]MDH6511297.1 hypothetical protein [Paenibacillus sp. PastM-3]